MRAILKRKANSLSLNLIIHLYSPRSSVLMHLAVQGPKILFSSFAFLIFVSHCSPIFAQKIRQLLKCYILLPHTIKCMNDRLFFWCSTFHSVFVCASTDFSLQNNRYTGKNYEKDVKQKINKKKTNKNKKRNKTHNNMIFI